MAHHYGAALPQGEGHGLRFTNDKWNDTIANDESFTVKWNRTVHAQRSELCVFKVTYPRNSVHYELVANLTEHLHGTWCKWTPDDLEDGLYAMWLTTDVGGTSNWAVSPPWKPRAEASRRDSTPCAHALAYTLQQERGLHWTAPIGIPIVVIFGLYAISLLTCLLHRRRKRRRREREDAERQAVTDDAERHASVSSEATCVNCEAERPPAMAMAPAKPRGGVHLMRPPLAFFLPHVHRHHHHPATGNTWFSDAVPDDGRRKGSTWSDDVVFDGVRFDSRSRSGSVVPEGLVHFGSIHFDRRRTGSVSTDGVAPGDDTYFAPGTAL